MQRPTYGQPPPNSPPLHHPVPQHVSTVPQLRSPPPPVPQQQSGYGNPYQQQAGPGAAAPSHAFGAYGGFMNDQTAQMGFQVGQTALKHGQEYVEQNFNRYINVSALKHYFDVSNSYVVNKLFLVLFPWRHKPWSRKQTIGPKGQEGWFLPPREDLNSPDMYIPVMAFVTYILLSTLLAGLRGAFQPELLGYTASAAFAIVFLEILGLKLGSYLLSISNDSQLLDLVAYSGYKFVGIIVTLVLSEIINRGQGTGGWAGWTIFGYTFLANAFFLVSQDPTSAAAAVVAGTTAAAMYIDAKTGIGADITALKGFKRGGKIWEEAVAKKQASLYYLWEESALRKGNDECIWSREGCYTWTQAYDRVHQYAQWFLAEGVKPKDLVGVYLQNSPDFMLIWVALWSIGSAPALINYNLAGEALVHCLKISGATILLVDSDEALQARINESKSVIEGELNMRCVNLEDAKSVVVTLPAQRPGNELRDHVKGSDPMCLLYTSGTTGLPKGCQFNVDRMHMVCSQRKAGTARTIDTDRWYDCMPFYHGTGGCAALNVLCNGVTLCVGKKFSTSQFWIDVRDSRSTWITYVGETARYLLAAPPSPLDLQNEVRGMNGNGLRPDVWIKFRDRFGITEIVEFFNSTEGVFALVNYCRGDYLATSVGHHGILRRRLLQNTFVPVRGDTGTGDLLRDPKTGFAIREPYDVGGEMLVAVPSEKAFQGYHNNPGATEKKFIRDVFKKGDLWYRSGDALRRTDDGRWFFLDRLGDTFRWKGENVSTAEVSEVIGRFPGVVEANVYGVQLPNHDGRAGCAAIYIDPTGRGSFDYAELLQHTRTRLPKYAVPIFLRIVENMTPIHNNKQNKVPLREEGVDPAKVYKGDEIVWAEAGGKTYQPFTQSHWDNLNSGKARL
ncbi:hypothetical protein VE02_00959 [Pseudogymnoascus sp. 03VT05]|nr:hypothetical protein VE02_00959 [Pseudogymnoascus sp. 03VT05]